MVSNPQPQKPQKVIKGSLMSGSLITCCCLNAVCNFRNEFADLYNFSKTFNS